MLFQNGRARQVFLDEKGLMHKHQREQGLKAAGHTQRNLPEIWGGVECTLNRVGDRYSNQLILNGHCRRPDDLKHIARLGIKTLRFPILWEAIAPDSLTRPDWGWCDQQLSVLRATGMTAIAGLLHHGSGPAYTSLVDPAFPDKLASFARMTAERYPWLTMFTPINEPLTTARFSGLYGHWYPHGRDNYTFVRALLNECAGTVAAMKAIREIIPAAKLVITEDIGKTYCNSDTLRYQTDFDNERRWLSLDLLFGRVDRQHPIYDWLVSNGALPGELDGFVQAPMPPDIIGLNYYLTSDRMLDEHLGLYPEQFHGGNGRHSYADVEAVRGWQSGITGHKTVFCESWKRYGKPLVMSEVHLGCTRDEQVRWFMEAWQAGLDLQAQGVELRAVTAWSLLGSYDWNSLVTEQNNHYEPGVFDVRAGQLRPTLLAHMITSLTETGDFKHPILDNPGWWRRSMRFLQADSTCKSVSESDDLSDIGRPLLIIGSSGTLGRSFARACCMRGLNFKLLSRSELDIAESASVEAALELYHPWAVINAAGYVRVDDAEDNIRQCFRENTVGPLKLAVGCRNRDVHFLTFSSDLVFDGDKEDHYYESDQVAPLNVYGRSKAEAERHVLKTDPAALVIRTSAFFSPWDNYNFITTTLAALRKGEKVIAADDLIISPTYVPDLINASLDLLLDGEKGIWHLSNIGGLSWAELAHRTAVMADLDTSGITFCSGTDMAYRARRPRNSIISSERGLLLPPLDDALQRYLMEIES